MAALNAATVVSALVIAFVSKWIWQYIRDPLRDIPGKHKTTFCLITENLLTYLQDRFGVDLPVFGNFSL